MERTNEDCCARGQDPSPESSGVSAVIAAIKALSREDQRRVQALLEPKLVKDLREYLLAQSKLRGVLLDSRELKSLFAVFGSPEVNRDNPFAKQVGEGTDKGQIGIYLDGILDAGLGL